MPKTPAASLLSSKDDDMTRGHKREAIRKADRDLRHRLGISFQDAQLASQWWSLMRHGELNWDEASAMRPALRRLNRLWRHKRLVDLNRRRSAVPESTRIIQGGSRICH